MDTFFEQLVPIKKDTKAWFLFIALTISAIGLMAVCFVFLGRYGIVFDFLIAYGAYVLYGKLSIEYEYIVTNDSFDVDKIIGKSSRKRVLSFEIPEISSIRKCDFSNIPQGSFAKKVIACNKTDAEVFCVIVKGRQGENLLVFSPNERIKQGLIKALPKHIDADILK